MVLIIEKIYKFIINHILIKMFSMMTQRWYLCIVVLFICFGQSR